MEEMKGTKSPATQEAIENFGRINVFCVFLDHFVPIIGAYHAHKVGLERDFLTKGISALPSNYNLLYGLLFALITFLILKRFGQLLTKSIVFQQQLEKNEKIYFYSYYSKMLTNHLTRSMGKIISIFLGYIRFDGMKSTGMTLCFLCSVYVFHCSVSVPEFIPGLFMFSVYLIVSFFVYSGIKYVLFNTSMSKMTWRLKIDTRKRLDEYIKVFKEMTDDRDVMSASKSFLLFCFFWVCRRVLSVVDRLKKYPVVKFIIEFVVDTVVSIKDFFLRLIADSQRYLVFGLELLIAYGVFLSVKEMWYGSVSEGLLYFAGLNVLGHNIVASYKYQRKCKEGFEEDTNEYTPVDTLKDAIGGTIGLVKTDGGWKQSKPRKIGLVKE